MVVGNRLTTTLNVLCRHRTEGQRTSRRSTGQGEPKGGPRDVREHWSFHLPYVSWFEVSQPAPPKNNLAKLTKENILLRYPMVHWPISTSWRKIIRYFTLLYNFLLNGQKVVSTSVSYTYNEVHRLLPLLEFLCHSKFFSRYFSSYTPPAGVVGE